MILGIWGRWELGGVEAQDRTVTLDEGLVQNQFMAGNRNVFQHLRDKIQGCLTF